MRANERRAGETPSVSFAHRASMSTSSSWIMSMWCQFASFVTGRMNKMSKNQQTRRRDAGCIRVSYKGGKKKLFRHLSQKNANKCARALQSSLRRRKKKLCYEYVQWCWRNTFCTVSFILRFLPLINCTVLKASLFIFPLFKEKKNPSHWVPLTFSHYCS